MVFPVYDMPQPKPDYGEAARRVMAQQDVLNYVIMKMAGHIDDGLSYQQQQLDSVSRSLLASGKARVNGNKRRLSGIYDALLSAAAASSAESTIQAQRAAQSTTAATSVQFVVLYDQGSNSYVYGIQGQLDPAYQSWQTVGTYANQEDATSVIATFTGTTQLVQPGVPVRVAAKAVQPASPTPVAAPPTADGSAWYCVTGFGTPAQPVLWTKYQADTNIAGSATSGAIILGPYSAYDEALAACSVPWTLPPQPPTSTPPPVTVTPPPPITVTPPPTSQPLPITVTPPPETALPSSPGLTVSPEFCSPGDYCARMLAMRQGLISLGNQLATDNIQATDWGFWTRVVRVWSRQAKEVDDFLADVATTIQNVESTHVVTTWQNLWRNCYGTALDDVAALTALRMALTWLADLSASVSDSARDDTSSTLSGNVSLWIVSGGQSSGSGKSHSYASNQSIKLIVLPLVQLIDFFIGWRLPTAPPSPGEAEEAYYAGSINRDTWRCYVEMAGLDWDAYRGVADSRRWHLDPRTAERLRRAGMLDTGRYNDLLFWSRITDADASADLRNAYQQYPGFQDVITFMVRDVFDPVVVRNNALDLEFTDKYTAAAERFGDIAGLDRETALLYWMAHWRQPSNMELYTMLHRLREGVVDPKLVVTQADVARQLGVADVSPAWRDKLVAISYISVSIRQARSFYQNYLVDEDQVEGIYLDHGYVPWQAKKAAENEAIVRVRQRAGWSHGWTVAAIANAFATGNMAVGEVNERMTLLGFDLAEAEQMMRRARIDRAGKVKLRAESRAITSSWAAILAAYQLGSLDRDNSLSLLLSHGWSQDSANIALAAEDVRARQKVVSQAVTTVKRSFLSAEIDATAALNQLTAVGVAPLRASEYLATWQLQLTPRRKALAGQQILRMASEGLLTADVARDRLALLGWSDPDLSLLISEVRNKRLELEAKALKTAELVRSKAAAALAKEIKAQQSLFQNSQQKLCHMVPVSRLIKWFAGHRIEVPYLVERLTTCGYTHDVIDGYVADATEARAKADAKAAGEIKALKAALGSTPGNGDQFIGPAVPG